eukprot:gene2784-5481_t
MKSTIVLKYWNGRGLMEVPRMLLAIAGQFPGDYEDGRFNAPQSNLEANLGRMPVLQVGDDSIGQSTAINYYISSEYGLNGESNLEAAKILAISEHIREMMDSYKSLVPYGAAPTEEALNTWFEGGAKDISGPADYNDRNRYFLWYMGRIEQSLDSSGYAVGGKISLADVLLYRTLCDYLKDEEAPPTLDQWKRSPFGGNKAKIDSMLTNYPKIHASCNAVASHPNIQKWLAMRGVQQF